MTIIAILKKTGGMIQTEVVRNTFSATGQWWQLKENLGGSTKVLQGAPYRPGQCGIRDRDDADPERAEET